MQAVITRRVYLIGSSWSIRLLAEIDEELPHEISLKLYLGYTLCICVAERDFPVWQVWIARPAPISRLFQHTTSVKQPMQRLPRSNRWRRWESCLTKRKWCAS